MLLEAFAWRPGSDRPAIDELLSRPDIGHYVSGWPRAGDVGIVAKLGGDAVGAAWCRLLPLGDAGYGYVADDVPELTVGVAAQHRGRGVGRAMLTQLLADAAAVGHRSMSLSVEFDNPAARLYQSVGFRRVGVNGNAWTMLTTLEPVTAAR